MYSPGHEMKLESVCFPVRTELKNSKTDCNTNTKKESYFHKKLKIKFLYIFEGYI